MLHMLERLCQTDLLAARNMQDLPSEPAVAQEGADMVVFGEKPLPLLFPIESGTLGMQGSVDRVRVVVESRIACIE
ncbi:hypothetical protein D3C72_2491190 [compost metagenome]